MQHVLEGWWMVMSRRREGRELGLENFREMLLWCSRGESVMMFPLRLRRECHSQVNEEREDDEMALPLSTFIQKIQGRLKLQT